MLDYLLFMTVRMLIAFALIFLVKVAFDSISWALVLLLLYVICYGLWRYHWIIKDYQREVDNYKCDSSTTKTHIAKLNSEIDSLNSKVSYWESKANEYQSLANDLQAKLSECESKLSHLESLSPDDPGISLEDKNLLLSSNLAKLKKIMLSQSEMLFIYEILSRIPRNVTFHYRDGLPVVGESNPLIPYGKLTVYLNRKSNVYHFDRACGSYACHPIHISEASSIARPCKRCCDESFTFTSHPQWYTDYLSIKDRAVQLGIIGMDNFISPKPTPADLDLYRHLM